MARIYPDYAAVMPNRNEALRYVNCYRYTNIGISVQLGV